MQQVRRIGGTALALALVMGTLAHAHAAAPPPRAAGPLDTATDLRAALRLETRMLDHFHYGQVHEQHYRTAERRTGDIATLTGENDSALYTGNYLAAQSYRYALAGQKLAALRRARGASRTDVRFWEQQRAEAKRRVDAMVDQFHVLINIAESWQTELDPTVNDDREPTEDGWLDFGGGVFPGEKGLLFRACNPVDAPAPLNVGRDPKRGRLVGPLKWRDGTLKYCLGATSRDAYAGVTFGLATAFDLVSPDDSARREMIRDDLVAMTDYALKYVWSNPRPHGSVVVPEVFGGNDLDNFYSPLFIYTPIARLNMLAMARHVTREAGPATDAQKFEALWLEELATEGPQYAGSMEIDAGSPHDSYYKFHLHHMTGFNVIRLERDPQVRELLRHGFGVMDATTRDDVNALFEAMTYALTGEPDRLAAAVQHHREYLRYRARLDANGNKTVNSGLCGGRLSCVPTDQVDVVLGGDVVASQPGTSTTPRAEAPLPVELRRAGDFMWQKDPTILDGDQGPTWESPAADFLLPYWMLRYYSEVARPSLEPFPAWPGPTFR